MQTPTEYDAPALKRGSKSTLQQLKEFDQNRPDFPGEHLIVFGLGALAMVAGMRSRTPLRRGLMTAVGTALIGRAASGTGGIAKVARVMRRFG
ncbi:MULTISPECIES: hypothetical protein [unclassified Bordetella]|uniref:hypothetical protein n=1 Tax=unclassified Bordetella TaxID=2630031 RepID=UPI001325A7DE|nr:MULTISPECIES: hypothetical protein [unclassified Bordetella]MVW71794.1 hypothetical protein [Bordetella sp. 15P40C-2]MVW77773.1 hypothetical protein [Bordetella sp. 02P26C-1]